MSGTRTHRPLQRFPDLPKHLFRAARQRAKRQKANAGGVVRYVRYVHNGKATLISVSSASFRIGIVVTKRADHETGRFVL